MKMKKSGIVVLLLISTLGFAQNKSVDSTKVYKKRVLESSEIDFITSYYLQDGRNAAVSGGIGTEELSDFTSNLVVSVPLNDDDILTVDAGISAYSSASSSNINPFDGDNADPFLASSGASSSDVWYNFTGSYNHSSDNRNNIWDARLSVSIEFDYTSFGFGGGYTKLFNEKNTEASVHANVFLDSWSPRYPVELSSASRSFSIDDYTITGNSDYNPTFQPFSNKSRNSYSLGFGLSQVLSKNLQTLFALDLVFQQGLLSTPYQRIYFSDIEDSFIEDFQLADAIELLPDTRLKVALGNRMSYYINEYIVLRSFYRYYFDDWGIISHTASLEIPVKFADKFTLYPSYRYYSQTAADYFAPYEKHVSTERFYTSDYDLSGFYANQYGFGITYTDIFTNSHIWIFGLKSIDLKLNYYERDTGFNALFIVGGFKFVLDDRKKSIPKLLNKIGF
ncbi:MAG: hypothetical protein A2X13_05155 [Bacteroidetes bacterium GWC2_33_15]|nr:MAG: hypothetical protein A2X10_11800 [Bacteroidetes bacterium GWA2_33_15]OFX51856.1 MAG: hypothetical protein A2X13_05155 [Bacteroidetes bacterium GWC2_33_15]OFX63424.1 MAG: hypothetical protein A2X15_01430 [Bacteroidetes bacterium GWB2_32_14]OFX67228.1 MAG: hypothetical protein A2X14_01320 [Bacteroidetes bacterium GWD2_33_33]